MPCPASAGAAETANGAVERMVLLGLTSRIIPNFAAMRLRCGRNQTAARPAAVARDTYLRPKTSLYSKTYTEGSDPFEPSYYIISAVMRLWCGRDQTAAKSAAVPGRKGLSQRHFISYISNRPAIGRSIPPHPAANFR